MSVDTVPALFLQAVKKFNAAAAFQYKDGGRYVDVSHQSVFERVDRASLGLTAIGVSKGDRVALLSENRVEWVIADQAILAAGAINVPVYPTLPANQVEYILRDSEARVVFVSTAEQLSKVNEVRKFLPGLQHIIVFDEDAAGDDLTLTALEARSQHIPDPAPFEERIATLGKYDWASIIYTSGTTGPPKGTILNQWNFVSSVNNTTRLFDTALGPDDVALSFLPLSHVFERVGGYYMLFSLGCTIAYAESIDTVAQNLGEVRPTIMLSVPRLYEKMYARILDAVSSGSIIKRNLFHWARKTGADYVKQSLAGRVGGGLKWRYGIADKLVFKKLRSRTGGRIKFFISGGAPLAREIAEFFYAAGLPILEGYGLTESTAILSVNTPADSKLGTVGKPAPGIDIRIADDGEILARGDNIMLGYYKKPDKTDEMIDGGWLMTGDIGHIDDDGFLRITDRKKDIIVTAGGKNIAPQPIENTLKTSKYVSQAVVLGNRQRFIAAIIVPNFENLRPQAASMGIDGDDHVLVANADIYQLYRGEIDRVCDHLAGFEQIKKFILFDREFTIDDGELTPTLKVKRSVVEKKFTSEIEAMYK